jgi:predicted acylesterase/phospholipase RssA
VFRLDKNILKIPVGENNAYFDPEPLETALKKVVREATESDNTPIAESGSPRCPVFVVTTFGRIADGPLKLFRSYGFDRDETPIWQAARATSAAPAFFPPARVDIPAPAGWYVDGGLRANNPSWEAILEGKAHWAARKCFIVSVGTGIQKPVDFIGHTTTANISKRTAAPPQSERLESTSSQNPELTSEEPASKRFKTSLVGGFIESGKNAGRNVRAAIGAATTIIADKTTQVTRIPDGIKASLHIMNALVNLSTSSESTHLRVYQEANSKHESAQFPYFRFNVLRGMDDIGLEEWNKVEAMADVTRSYLQSPLVEDELRKCAGGLVNPTAFEST